MGEGYNMPLFEKKLIIFADPFPLFLERG
jgi:hypothetical protein